MSDDSTLSIAIYAALTLFFVLSIYGAYRKGCRDTWKAADEITQVESILPLEREPYPIELQSSPFKWPEMLLTTNCRECQGEQEQAL